jgi:hypothetical protein
LLSLTTIHVDENGVVAGSPLARRKTAKLLKAQNCGTAELQNCRTAESSNRRTAELHSYTATGLRICKHHRTVLLNERRNAIVIDVDFDD